MILNEGNLSCNSDSNCEVLAIGDKACGGPQTYLIASTLNDIYEPARFARIKFTNPTKGR